MSVSDDAAAGIVVGGSPAPRSPGIRRRSRSRRVVAAAERSANCRPRAVEAFGPSAARWRQLTEFAAGGREADSRRPSLQVAADPGAGLAEAVTVRVAAKALCRSNVQ